MPGPAEVSCLGLLLSGGSLVLGPAEVSDSGLFPYTCSCEVCFLRPVLAEVTVSGLFPQNSLVWASFQRGSWLGPSPPEVSGSGLLP